MTSQDLSVIQQTIEHILELMEVQTAVSIEVDDQNVVSIQIDGDDLGTVIGYHGETLSALQTIIGLIINKDYGVESESRYKIIVNVGDYRQRQKEALEALARRTAERVRFTKKPITLPPMSSYDRRIVHLFLESDPELATYSEGEGRSRRLIVKLKD